MEKKTEMEKKKKKRKSAEDDGAGEGLLSPPVTRKKCKPPPPQSDLIVRSAPIATTRVVRLQRKGGKVVQDCDVYIGRRLTMGGWNLPQSKWHNPFSVKQAGSVEKAVELFEDYIKGQPELMASLGQLKGKVLGCWCKKKPSDPCHGDVLVRLVKALDETPKTKDKDET